MSDPGIVIGYDLGSAHMGVTPLLDHAPPIEIPWQPVTIGVDPENLDAVVAVAVNLAVSAKAARAAIEHGKKFYPPRLTVPEGASPALITKLVEQHRRACASMAENHRICSILQRELTKALTDAGVEAVTWARESWAHRVVQHKQGGIKTSLANEGLRALIAPGSWELLKDQHQRDAAGVGCMWLVDPPAPPKRYRAPRARPGGEQRPKLSPEQYAAKRLTAAREGMRRLRGDASAEERIAAGCVCIGKHIDGCPVREQRQRGQIAKAIAHGSWLR